MKKVMLLVLTCTMLSGCISLTIGGGDGLFGKKKGIPAKPQTDYRLEELVRKEADISSKLAQKINSTGTDAKSIESNILVESTDKIVTFMGKPAKPIPIDDVDSIDKLHRSFEDRLSKYRAQIRDWEDTIMQMREDQIKLAHENGVLKSSLDKAKRWFWILIIIIVVIMVAFPSTIPLFIRWGKSAGKSLTKVITRQSKEVIDAVQEIRNKAKENGVLKFEEINSILGTHQSADTIEFVRKLKKGLVYEQDGQ